MEQFFDRFKIDCSPVAHKSHTLIRDGVRLTVLTPCLLRVETQSKSKFCDEPTQSVWFRDFCEAEYKFSESKNTVEIKSLFYTKRAGLGIAGISLLGSDKEVKYERDENSLRITDYEKISTSHPICFRIELI